VSGMSRFDFAISLGPSFSATRSPSATPSTLPSAISSASAGPTGTTPSGTTPPVTVPGPGRYVAGAWLSPAQLPFARAGYTTWDHESGIGTLLGGSAYEQTAQQYTVTSSCSSIGSASALGDGLGQGLGQGLAGAQVQVFQSSNSGKIWPDGTIPAHASQYALSADYASCETQVTRPDPATGATLAGSVQQTVNDGSAQCWTLVAAQPGSTAAIGTADHTCFVRSGAMIGTVTVSVNQVGSLPPSASPQATPRWCLN
jgi:hypothetical protein